MHSEPESNLFSLGAQVVHQFRDSEITALLTPVLGATMAGQWIAFNLTFFPLACKQEEWPHPHKENTAALIN